LNAFPSSSVFAIISPFAPLRMPGLLDVESHVHLAVFLQSAIDGLPDSGDTARDPSARGEPLGQGTGLWQLRFKISGRRRVTAVTRCRESGLDLLHRQLRHLRILRDFKRKRIARAR
jgi:hypothetical protein